MLIVIMLIVFMLIIIMLIVFMLIVIMLIVIVLNDVAPSGVRVEVTQTLIVLIEERALYSSN
jgi:uncharacterized protein YggT (Ycf19 family)